jgi:AcrR family transcriptional regulator
VPEAESPGPGRPSTGARERILGAALDVLKEDGFAGLSNAKVADRAGENKALISYHFGSKAGLVREVAQAVAAEITGELLGAIGDARDMDSIARRLVDGIAAIPRRDPGLARLYFDLAGWSAVEPEIKSIMAEMKDGFQATLRGLLPVEDAAATALLMIACVEGFTLEQLEHGETPELERARDLFVASLSR